MRVHPRRTRRHAPPRVNPNPNPEGWCVPMCASDKKINRSHTQTPTENNTPDTDTHTHTTRTTPQTPKRTHPTNT